MSAPAAPREATLGNTCSSIQHGEQVIKRGRAFFDSWLERFPTWADFVQGVLQNPLAEFGPSRENTIKQVSDWLGGAAEAGTGQLPDN